MGNWIPACYDRRNGAYSLSLILLCVLVADEYIQRQLIYILGYDLLKEAVWDTWGRVSGFDYSTIWIIILAMTYFDFVVGIGVGSKFLSP